MSVPTDTAHRRKQLPQWLVAVVILLTGAFTMWAMSMTSLRGPSMAWEQAHDMVDSVWGQQKDSPQMPSPGPAWAAIPQVSVGNGARQVAGFPGVPSIVAGVRPIHADRGVCTNCHSVLTAQRAPVPSISSLSVMPHAYRGVCSNCHEFTFGAATASRPVARTLPGAPGIAAPPAPRKQPAEAEWQGLEVMPSAGRVMVAGVEGVAAQRGVLANDIVTSINGVATPTMADFVAVTANGKLKAGTMIVRRGGQRLAFELGTKPAPAPQAPLPAAGNTLPPLTQPTGPHQVQF